MRLRSNSICILASAGLLAAAPSAQNQPGQDLPGGAGVEVPGLARYSVQDLQAPAMQIGEPAALYLEIDGAPHSVWLEPHSMRSDTFRLLEVRDGSVLEVEPGTAATYRGELFDLNGNAVAGARIAASEGDAGWNMVVNLPDDEPLFVQPVAQLAPSRTGTATPGLHVVYRGSDVESDGKQYRCGLNDILQTGPTLLPDSGDPPALAVTGREICEVAFDCDVEFYQANGSDVVNTMRDVEDVMNNVEVIYERDVDITYEISAVVVRSGGTGSDPYVSSDAGTMLGELQSEWNANFGSLPSDTVHLMTGKNVIGGTIGIAFLGVICNSSFAYGLSQSRFTSFMSSRSSLTAHEIGHNWGAGHCDGNGDCHIMCSGLGGCNGLGTPNFGTPSSNTIAAFRNSIGCLTDEPDFLSVPFIQTWPTTTIDSDIWVYNDGTNVRDDQPDNAPSPTGALKINSQGTTEGTIDDIRSHFIDLSGETAGTLTISFFTQHQGVEAGETLILQDRNMANKKWRDLVTVTSDGIDQTEFEFHKYTLNTNAYHDRFRIRFTTTSDQLNDWWFVDNIVINDQTGVNLAQDEMFLGSGFDTTLHGANQGEIAIFGISFAATTGTGPTLFGVTLDLLPPLASLGGALVDANGEATLSAAAIPSNFPMIPLHTQAIVLRGPGNSDSVKTIAITQTPQ